MLVCCWGTLRGCTAKPNTLSYGPPHAISYNSGSAASSFFPSWICREDCHFPEVSWSASTSFLSLSITVYTSFIVDYNYLVYSWSLARCLCACLVVKVLCPLKISDSVHINKLGNTKVWNSILDVCALYSRNYMLIQNLSLNCKIFSVCLKTM